MNVVQHIRLYFAGPAAVTALVIGALGPVIVTKLWSNVSAKAEASAQELPRVVQLLIDQPMAISLLALPALVLAIVGLTSKRLGLAAGIVALAWVFALFILVLYFFIMVMAPLYEYQDLG